MPTTTSTDSALWRSVHSIAEALLDIAQGQSVDSINVHASIQRDGPANGLGKPEALRHKPGWSRRINDKDRILYHLVESGDIRITSLRGHYDD